MYSAKRFVEDIRKLGFHLELEILRPFPLSWAIRWLRFQGRVKYFIQPRRRKASEQWMRRILPEDATAEQRRHGAHEHLVFDEALPRLAYLVYTHDVRKFEHLIEIEGLERIDESLRQGRGVVLLTTHVGFPSLLRWLLRSKDYRVLHLMKLWAPRQAKTMRDRYFLWLRARFNLDDADVIGNEELSLQYMKRAYDFLRQNGVVHIAGDGPVGDRRTTVTICGQEQSLPLGGLALGVMSTSVILPVFTLLEPSFQIRIQEPLPLPKGESLSQQLESLAAAYAKRIEAYVLKHPSNVYQYTRSNVHEFQRKRETH